MPTNFYMYFITALIPLIIGSIYYNPKVLGTAWMKAGKFSEEYLREANMTVIFIMTYIFSVMLSMALGSLTIHQGGAFSMMMPEVLESGSEVQQEFNMLMEKYGENSRTFGHGALHGFLGALFIALPIIGINSLFERRGWKYLLIHFGYWAISLALMGGLICATLQFAPLS
ncbi:MAG: DUF1761 domain-containing protein [Saprospiraceae bacterium]|nr:DUF1761 domain-containing protein [Saprospiraceae bacterium]